MSCNTDDDCYEDVHLDDLNKHPSCPHGPTLLFSRKTKIGIRKFYACSACRDRKLCCFFHWADEKYSEERKNMWECEQRKYVGYKTHEEMLATLCEIRPAESEKRLSYCHSCCKLVLNDVGEHKNHDMTLHVTLHQLVHPTELLKPLNCDKREAQYLFSEASLNVLINITLENEIKSVICIGAPRIHERIKTSPLNMRSILLDIDKRYHMFYGPDDFCWFNSFNCHFFLGQTSKQAFRKFLKNDEESKMLLVLDPPFGGRLEPLAHTITKIKNLYEELNPSSKEKLFIILIYPYFMEQHVMNCFPTLKMIDYKVTYDNHPLFSQVSKGRKLRSPVRIFSNINPTKISLPEEEGYKFCSICNCWVGSENNHCNICNKCTSKNGSTYVHCKKCQKCVKPSWKHCYRCKRCCLEEHECSNSSILKSHLNDKYGHRNITCMNLKDDENGGSPIVNISSNIRKRKGNTCKRKNKKKKC